MIYDNGYTYTEPDAHFRLVLLRMGSGFSGRPKSKGNPLPSSTENDSTRAHDGNNDTTTTRSRRNATSTRPTSSSSSSLKNNYSSIPDHFKTLDQVTNALRRSGLESSNLIIGVDFTKSNEWTGQLSFNNRSLHAMGVTANPYEQAISIIGKTLSSFDEDNLIPCFGFGDSTTHDQQVFSFHSDHSPCHGFEEVLTCYRNITPNLKLSGPTSYGPIVDAAVDIVERSGGQFHVLLIVADGQVTRSVDTEEYGHSPQEEKTIQAIVNASSYPLSIVLVGVGDGPWNDMKKFDDKIPVRIFDNFQFVNFTAIMAKISTPAEREAAFAVAALMEIPYQYKAAIEYGLLGNVKRKAKGVIPRPPPPPGHYTQPFARKASDVLSSSGTGEYEVCAVCLTNRKDLAFCCGHMTCRECGSKLSNCPICRQPIRNRLRLFTC